MVTKKLRDMNRYEWVRIKWIEVTPAGETERVFTDNGLRTPEESMQAEIEWTSLDKVNEGM